MHFFRYAKLLILLSCLIGYVLTNITHGASFDCTKSKNDQERLMGSNTALSKADDDLAKAYTRQIRYSEPSTLYPALKESQRRWLTQGIAPCELQTTCLLTHYQKRINFLNNIEDPHAPNGVGRWSGVYKRTSHGKPSKHPAELLLIATDGRVEVDGQAFWVGNSVKGQVHIAQVKGKAKHQQGQLKYMEGDCRLRLELLRSQGKKLLRVADIGEACGGMNVTFTGDYVSGQ